MAQQGFVKLFGASSNRVLLAHSVFDEVKRAGCHWACTYPVSKRPRQVQDGAAMFMGRLVNEPNDIRVFGRAIAMEHRPGRDNATPEDIKLRPWKERWPCYIRVNDAEFIDGVMRDGVSLEQLMNELGAESFASTSRHASEKSGKNTDPRAALRQQSHVELTPRAIEWLNRGLNRSFERHGKISADRLAKLDWPKIPAQKYPGS